MPKNEKITLKKLEGLVSVVARNVADIKNNMATKDDLSATERRLSAKIEVVEEKVDNLEMVDVLDLQQRVSVLEKDVKQIKHKHV